MPIEQVHDLVAQFLEQHTLSSARTPADRHQRESSQKGTPSKPAAARDAPTQARGQLLALSRSAGRTMDAGLRALNAGALDKMAYQTLLQAVRTGTAITPALARIIVLYDTPGERHGSKPAAPD
jgi:hypothetical protein